MPSNHLLVAAAAAAAALALPGCLDFDTDPIAPRPEPAEPDDPPPPPRGDGKDCFEGASFFDVTPNLARGARLDVDIRSSYDAAAGAVSSSNPAVLQVTKSYEGALITGLAPGVAELVVSRCGAAVARYTVRVSDVAVVELQFVGAELAPAVAVLPAPSSEILHVTYRAADGRVLAGTGAAELELSADIRRADTPPLRPAARESMWLQIEDAGQITATVPGGPVATLDISMIPLTAVATLSLELTTSELFDTPYPTLIARAATADGTPIIGFSPVIAVDPVGACDLVSLIPRLFWLIEATGEITFTATLGAATATLTHAFPE